MAQSQDGVKFLHFRKFNEDGSIDPRGGSTVAYINTGVTNATGDEVIRYATAFCSKNDNFVKSRGRELAKLRALDEERGVLGRYNSEKEFVAVLTERENDHGLQRKYATKRRG